MLLRNHLLWLYVPVTIIIIFVFAIATVRGLAQLHQQRALNTLITTEQAVITPGYIQGIRRVTGRATRKSYAYVDYATVDLRLTLRTRISDEMQTTLTSGTKVNVKFDPDNPRNARMEGAEPDVGWGKKLGILFMTAVIGICMQMLVFWTFSPSRKYTKDFNQEAF